MKPFYICVLYIGLSACGNGQENKVENKSISKLKRAKRYVSFPEGSTFIVALCLTMEVITPFELFLQGINWGVSYDLPNSTTISTYAKEKNVLRRKHRRDLYNRAETVIDKIGYDGRSCIYRALCEAPRRIVTKNVNLSQHLLKLFFTYPLDSLTHEEPHDHRLYHWAYRRGREQKYRDCAEIFPDCPISIVDLALGYYNNEEL